MGGQIILPPVAVKQWKIRAVTATKGNQSRLGCILICMLGYMPKNPPRMRGLAVITSDGRVLVDCQLAGQAQFFATDIGSVEEVRDNMRGLADHLKLSDADRVEMFDELRKWFARDFRATSTLET